MLLSSEVSNKAFLSGSALAKLNLRRTGEHWWRDLEACRCPRGGISCRTVVLRADNIFNVYVQPVGVTEER